MLRCACKYMMKVRAAAGPPTRPPIMAFDSHACWACMCVANPSTPLLVGACVHSASHTMKYNRASGYTYNRRG